LHRLEIDLLRYAAPEPAEDAHLLLHELADAPHREPPIAEPAERRLVVDHHEAALPVLDHDVLGELASRGGAADDRSLEHDGTPLERRRVRIAHQIDDAEVRR